jgi:hypothetical protein
MNDNRRKASLSTLVNLTPPPVPAMHVIRITLSIALLVSAMLLPYVPGRYDPLATNLSAFATGGAFGGLLLVPIGAAWLISNRGYTWVKVALSIATVVVLGAALVTAANGSLATAAVALVICVTWLVHVWRRVRATHHSGGNLPRTVPVALILIPLTAMAARLGLVESAATWSRNRAIANSARIIADIERFRERNGSYPIAINSLWPDYHPGIIGVERYRYEPSGKAYNLYFEHPSTDFAAREIVMFNPRSEQDFSSHALDLLQLSPEEIRRQRGYFRSQDLPQANWKRFLFD